MLVICMDAVNPLNTLNTLNLKHGGALKGHCESAVNSKHSEFGTWWCSEFGHCESTANSKHSEHSEFGTWWCFEWMP